MLKNEVLLIFGEDYGRHPHCLEHVINELLPYNTVLWIETIGMRSPRFTFYDFKRILQIIAKWIFSPRGRSSERYKDNLKILAPVMLPFTDWKIVRRINQIFATRKIKHEIKKRGLANPILITSLPSACDFAKKIEEKLTVYYCVDEFSLWPGIPFERVKSMENELIKKSDLIFATSSCLAESKKTIGKKTHLLTHGVNVNHFNLSSLPKKNRQRNKICYFGLIDERCDQELIAFIAQSLPDCLITIIGEVVARDTSFLRQHTNVIFEKRVGYDLLPTRIQDQDYFILPYCINELTNNINPSKIKEYLATGKPVISTALPEVIKLSDFLYIAENKEHFVKLLVHLMTGKLSYSSEPTLMYLKNNESWTAKASYFSDTIQNAILCNELIMK